MFFKRATISYGRTPEPETPYQKAAQVWDERIGSARVQARNWRLMAFGCLVLAGGLSFGVAWQTGHSTVTPYVVEVDRLGEVKAIGPALEAYSPSDAQIAWHLARFIENVRSLSIDPIIVRENWLAAYDVTTTEAANTLNEFARQNDPFGKVGTKTVTVEVTSVVRSSPESFDIRWREEEFENGTLGATTHHRAVVTVIVKPPRTEAALRRNPLGIYVHAVNWSRELTPKEEK
ncbi:conjugal transfer protein TrbF [Roseibium algicola]|uniref:Conjugal transfer protein TrbF n=1 Tax=Roseibium algicola TaxID=2857014 RepID=A0ABN4WYS7_9HYPH|nr:conjugal transfer protein TrbF [Roseibium aggregatum]AQQ05411.1 conjugal transfer protein TrbF [Roseibium aggregatum]